MTFLTLLRRQFAARPWPTLLLALVVAVVSALVTAVPRMVTDLDDRQLSQRLSSLSAIQGDVTGTWTPTLNLGGTLHDPWDGYREHAEAIRAAQPEPLRSLLAPAQFVSEFATTLSSVPPASSGYYKVTYHLLADPDLQKNAHLVDGEWPKMGAADGPQEIAVLDSAAEKMGWRVGDTLAEHYVISGIFAPNDPSDVRWEHNELGRRYTELNNPNLGVELVVGAFVPPELVAGDPSLRLQAPFRTTVWYRLDADRVGQAGLDVSLLNTQVTGMLAPTWEIIAPGPEEPSGKTVRLTTELGPVLTSVAAGQRTTRTLAAVSAAGPAGVAVAVLVLAAGLVADRRRGMLALTRARGLSVRQQRGLAVAEGLAVGLPAVMLGHVVASLLSPGSDSWVSWLVTILLAAVPVVALVVALSGVQRVGGRPIAHGGRWRIVGEALVVVAAVAATWRLATAPAPASGVDWLAVASPLLLALAVCLVVLRLYPLPLRALESVLRRGTGLTGFLGSARALRQPAGGLVPVVAMVLGTTLAVTSAVLLGTVSSATAQRVWDQLGADIKVSGPTITDDLAAQLQAVDGVTAVSRIRDAASNANITVGGSSTGVHVWLAEPTLPAVYAAGDSGGTGVDSLFKPGAAAPVLVGGVHGGGSATLAGLGDVRVACHLSTLPGVIAGPTWALVDVARWPGGAELRPTVALISVTPGADPAAVAEAVSKVVPGAKVESAAAELQALRDTPTLTSLGAIFTLLSASTVVLLLLAICTAQLLAAESRRTTGAVLRTLGLPTSKLRTLTAWELVPSVVASLVVGVAAGIGIAALLLKCVDFTVLTGGSAAPALHLDPVGVGAVVGALVLASAISILLSAALAGRVDVATQLRRNDE